MVQTVVRGISKQGRSKTYHRRGLWAIKKKHGGKFPQHEKKAKAPAAEKKTERYYPADDAPHPKTRRSTSAPTKLKASIQPGTILILLAGRFKGKRVVFLRQLPSGLLLVTGPFSVNGVPLRRVNQSFVIATSTQADISKVDASKFDDSYFHPAEKKPKFHKKKKGEVEFFDESEKKKGLPAEFIENQKTVDSALTAGLSADLKGYLSTRFSLKSNDRPHLMKF